MYEKAENYEGYLELSEEAYIKHITRKGVAGIKYISKHNVMRMHYYFFMANPPNFRKLDYDHYNPDLDRRYTPIDHCFNKCEWCNMKDTPSNNGELFFTEYRYVCKCTKHNYMLKEWGDVGLNGEYFICDDYSRFKKIDKAIESHPPSSVLFKISNIIGWTTFILMCLFAQIYAAPDGITPLIVGQIFVIIFFWIWFVNGILWWYLLGHR